MLAFHLCLNGALSDDYRSLTIKVINKEEKLWFRIDRRCVTAIHVQRHRLMLMDNFPFVIDFAKAERLTHPDVRLITVAFRTADSVQTISENHLTILCGMFECLFGRIIILSH
jgi:hypothetical protein